MNPVCVCVKRHICTDVWKLFTIVFVWHCKKNAPRTTCYLRRNSDANFGFVLFQTFTMKSVFKIAGIYLFIVHVVSSEEKSCLDGSSTCVKANEHSNDSHGGVNLYSRGEYSVYTYDDNHNFVSINLWRVLNLHLESNEFIAKINQALAEYEPCEEKNCGCHAGTITKSLHPFRNGITKKMLDDVRQLGTKYQIIDKRIYRDPSCLFPSRCAGIEYFLKANIQKIPDLEMIVNCRDWPQISNHHVIKWLQCFSLLLFVMRSKVRT